MPGTATIADDVVDELVELEKPIRNILEESKQPEDLGGLTPGKLMTVQMGIRETDRSRRCPRGRRGQGRARQAMAVDAATFDSGSRTRNRLS